MDFSQFTPFKKNETRSVQIVKLLQKVDEKPHEILKFEMSQKKQRFNFDKSIKIPEKEMMAVFKLQVFNTGYIISERKNKVRQ